MKKTLLIVLAVLVLFNLNACDREKKDKLSVVEKLNRADRMYNKGKFGEAEKLYLEIIRSYGDSPEAYLKLSKIYRARREFKVEEEILLQGIEKTEYTNDLRERLIDLYLNGYRDVDKGREAILALLEANLHSYKFEFIKDEYREYMEGGKFKLILEVYKNNNHQERMPIYLMEKAGRDPSEENLRAAFDELEKISLGEVSFSMQNKILNFYMRHASNDDIGRIVSEISDSNRQGSIFQAYDHWLTDYKGEYILEDVLRIDIDGDGVEENILLLIKDSDEEGKMDYSLEIQNSDTGEIYDKYSGISDFERLKLEYPLQANPNEHRINLVQSKEEDELEFIDVFLISNRRINKPL